MADADDVRRLARALPQVQEIASAGFDFRVGVLGEPELFFTAPGYGDVPLVMVRLDRVDTERLRELVVDAWRMRAPEELAAGFDEESFASEA